MITPTESRIHGDLATYKGICDDLDRMVQLARQAQLDARSSHDWLDMADSLSNHFG